MTAPTYTVPSLGGFNTAEDPKIANALQNIYDILNGNIDSANIANNSVSANDLLTALAQQLGISNALNTGRGYTAVATEQTTTSTSFVTLATADVVSSVVLPSNGLICVAYQAMWKGSGGAPRAAIFLNSTQVSVAARNASSVQTQGAAIAGSSFYNPLATTPLGLASGDALGSDYGGDATTGQIIGVAPDLGGTTGARFEVGGTGASLATSPTGGPCFIFAAAGTYDVSIKFKISAGTLSAKNRKLWVWTMGF